MDETLVASEVLCVALRKNLSLILFKKCILVFHFIVSVCLLPALDVRHLLHDILGNELLVKILLHKKYVETK